MKQAAYMAEMREPWLLTPHLACAVAFMVTAPLGVVPGEITGGMLLVVSAARWRETLAMLRVLLGMRMTWLLLAVVAWTLVAALWSPMPVPGLRRLSSLRALLLVPALMPFAAHRTRSALLCAALGVGVSVLACSQAVQLLRAAPALDGAVPRFGGLHGDQGKAGLWADLGVCLGVGLLLAPGSRSGVRVAAGALAMVAGGGLAIAATLRAMLGLAIGLPLACLAGALRRGLTRRAMLTALGTLVITCAGVATFKGQAIGERVRTSWREVQANLGGTHGGNTGTRVYWLKAGLWAAREHPVLGWGTGATPRAIGAFPGRLEMEKASHTAFPEGAAEPGHPHSIYLMSLVESGPTGLLLLLALAWATVATLARSATGPASVGFLAFGVAWFVAAGFDTVFNFSTLSALAIAVALGAFPPEEERRCAC